MYRQGLNIVTGEAGAMQFAYTQVIGIHVNDGSMWSITYPLHDNHKYGNRWKWAAGIKDIAEIVFKGQFSELLIIGRNETMQGIEGVDNSLQREAMEIFKIPEIAFQLQKNICPGK